MCKFLKIFDKNYWNFIITSSHNVNNNLFKLLCGINIMPMVFWSESRLKNKEIYNAIDLGHRTLDGVPPQRWSKSRLLAKPYSLLSNSINTFS